MNGDLNMHYDSISGNISEGDSFGISLADGKTEDKHFTHIQNLASDYWKITHNMNKYPSVTVLDSAGSIIICEIEYIDTNNIALIMSAPFSGVAYLN